MTRYTDAEKAAAVDHIVTELEKGIHSARQIRAAMEPPIPEQTFMDWRKADATIGQRVDDAFELGSDNMANRMRLTAQGKKAEDGGDSTGSVYRDKLVLWWDEKFIARRNTRYQAKTVLANDPTNPVTDPKKPFALTEAQLLTIAAQGARAKPDGNG